jgi:2-hydroxychromene-2-carboxylate isomerase
MIFSAMLFYFDFISPYAYLAWTQLPALAARHERELVPVPVLFAALLNAHGQKGPAEIPAKRIYLFKDVCRKAHLLGLPPVVPPPAHPFNPLLALRAATFPADKDPAGQRRLIDELFAATWAGGGGVETDAAVGACAERAGFDAAAVLAYAHSEAAKLTLRQHTEQALGHGVFGVPTIAVAQELFWGTDSLPALQAYLLGNDPLTHDSLRRWEALRPSATRTPR